MRLHCTLFPFYYLSLLLIFPEFGIAAPDTKEIKFNLQKGSSNEEIIFRETSRNFHGTGSRHPNRQKKASETFTYTTVTNNQVTGDFSLTIVRGSARSSAHHNNFSMFLYPQNAGAGAQKKIEVIPFTENPPDYSDYPLLLENFPAIPFSNGDGFYLPLVSNITEDAIEYIHNPENPEDALYTAEHVFHVSFDYSITGARIEALEGIIRINIHSGEFISLKLTGEGGGNLRILTPLSSLEESEEGDQEGSKEEHEEESEEKSTTPFSCFKSAFSCCTGKYRQF